jgi:hypothetical protein
LGPIVRSQITDNTESLKRKLDENVRKSKLAMKESEQQHKKKLKEIEQRVQQRPLMMDQTNTKQKEKMARLENLLKVKETAKASGVKNIDGLFTPEERDLIIEAELLQTKRKDLNLKK